MSKHEQLERKTYDRFRALGCTKGESMKAVNQLRNTMDGAKEIFVRKFKAEHGHNPAEGSINY